MSNIDYIVTNASSLPGKTIKKKSDSLLVHDIGFASYIMCLAAQNNQKIIETRMPLIKDKFLEWISDKQDKQKIFNEVMEEVNKHSSDPQSMIDKLSLCMCNIKNSMSMEHRIVFINDLLSVISSASSTEAEIGQLIQTADFLDVKVEMTDKREEETKTEAPLIKAVEDGDVKKVQAPLDNGADIDAEDEDGSNALSTANNAGRKDIAELLKKYASKNKGEKPTQSINKQQDVDTDINAKDEEGKTPLISAAEDGDTETIKRLLDKGADIEAKNDYGMTALMWASMRGKTETVRLLLDKGADIEAKNNEGMSALLIAEAEGKEDTASLLKKHADNINRAKPTQSTKEQKDVDGGIAAKHDDGTEITNQHEELFRQKVREALADGIVTDIERTDLDSIQDKMKLSDDDAMRIFEEIVVEIQAKSEGKQSIGGALPSEAIKDSDNAKKQDDDAGRITYNNFSEFKDAQCKYPHKKPFLMIAEKVHDILCATLNENHLPYEIRYGDGTFSVSVAKEMAKSRKRTCARFGLLDLSGKNSYLESLYKKEDDPLPQGAEYWRKNDLTQFQYSFYLNPETSIQDLEKSISGALLKSYSILSKGE